MKVLDLSDQSHLKCAQQKFLRSKTYFIDRLDKSSCMYLCNLALLFKFAIILSNNSCRNYLKLN